MPKEPTSTNTAVAEPEQAVAAPQTAAEIAATAEAIGLAPAKASASTAVARPTVKMGVAPTTIDEAWRMANLMAQSELVPKGYRGRPADVLVCIQFGMEVGLPPMAALHSVFVTNGRPSLWGDGFLAIIMSSPKYRDHDEYYMVDGTRREFLLDADLLKDDTTAVTTFWRSDSERPRTATFSIAKAKKANLLKKAGPWQEYPDRMLKYRARGFAGHDAFPDVLRGIKTAEEIIDVPAAYDGPAETDTPAPREVRRLSETKAAPVLFDPSVDHMHTCRGGHEWACAEKKCATTPRLDCATHDVTMAPSENVVLNGVEVKTVQQFLGGYSILLADGRTVDTTEAGDAGGLEQFIGTKHRVRLVCTKLADGNLQLQSFAIAD